MLHNPFTSWKCSWSSCKGEALQRGSILFRTRSTTVRVVRWGSLKLDKQYKKDANEAKIYIDGIKARQTAWRTLTPSYVFNVCIIHAHEHDVTYVNGILTQMYDRQPCAGYIKRLTRVPWFHSSRLWLTWATRIQTWKSRSMEPRSHLKMQ